MGRKIFMANMLGFLLLILAGCGGQTVESYLQKNYQLVDAKTSSVNQEDIANIYRVPKGVQNTAEELSGVETPDNQTPGSSDRMLLLYPEKIVSITKDGVAANQSLVEVASKDFVANNYTRDSFLGDNFLTGYLAAEILDEIGDIFEHRRYSKAGQYYGGGTVRKGDSIRGGGPSVGK